MIILLSRPIYIRLNLHSQIRRMTLDMKRVLRIAYVSIFPKIPIFPYKEKKIKGLGYIF